MRNDVTIRAGVFDSSSEQELDEHSSDDSATLVKCDARFSMLGSPFCIIQDLELSTYGRSS